MALYDRIGPGYDATRRADPGIVARLRTLGQWQVGQRVPSFAVVEESLRGAGFRHVRGEPFEVTPELVDLFLYGGKQRPALYLDPRVRAGISTFASLADPAEVQAGCERLARDIESGRIAEVMAAFRHDGGDYLFVVGER